MELSKHTILLTGASGGIGLALAEALNENGAKLVLTGRNKTILDHANTSMGGHHHVCIADLATKGGREAVIDAARRHNVSIIVHNAGSGDFSSLETQQEATIERSIALNLTAPVFLTQQLLPILKTRQQAALVYIGSTFGSIGYPGYSVYCATKFGLRGFTQSLRRELADTHIHIGYVAPRATATAMNSDTVVAMNQALGNKMDSPDVVASAVVKLLLDKRNEVYVGWPEKLFARLNALLPAVVDRALKKQLPTVQRYLNKESF